MFNKPNDISASRVTDENLTLSTSESEFWRWFRPSLAENWMRGVIGEYWVAHALDILHKRRHGWETWDLETEHGIRIEVKTAGYLQSWHQSGQKPSTPVFGINAVNVEEDRDRGLCAGQYRPANVYVFCLHTCLELTTLDPLDISQWEFYVLATKELDAQRPNGKSINLGPLKDLGAKRVLHVGLKYAILRAAKAE